MPANRERADAVALQPASGNRYLPAGSQQPPDGLRGELSAQREADRITVNQFAPPGVLINAELQVLQFRGATGAFLEPPVGKASFDVLKMAREGLMLPLRAAINEAKKENKTARKEQRPGQAERRDPHGQPGGHSAQEPAGTLLPDSVRGGATRGQPARVASPVRRCRTRGRTAVPRSPRARCEEVAPHHRTGNRTLRNARVPPVPAGTARGGQRGTPGLQRGSPVRQRRAAKHQRGTGNVQGRAGVVQRRADHRQRGDGPSERRSQPSSTTT